MTGKLLTRDEFREAVFSRDGHRCLTPGCSRQAADAHHIFDRALWTAPEELGGYFLENGVSLCPIHHVHAERGHISPQAFWLWLGVTETLLPSSIGRGDLDKWGNELPISACYVVKYPKTLYLDISPQPPDDSLPVLPTATFTGFPLVLTIKMDGSNCVLTHEGIGARNGQHANHPSFSMLKAMSAACRFVIPATYRIFGEWLYAKHSIHYAGELALPTYLQLFAIYDTARRLWLGWDEVERMADLIPGAATTPVVGRGCYDESWEVSAWLSNHMTNILHDGHEGLVVRSQYPFHFSQFRKYVGKMVRENHVQTDDHWAHGPVVHNELKCTA